MSLHFTVPASKQIRVIIDTDAACEADDPYAIAHALMSPKLCVRALCAEQFGKGRQDDSTRESYAEIERIVRAMRLETPIYLGVLGTLEEAGETLSPAAEAIIREAMRDSQQPLFVLCLGAATNIAQAIRTRPDIIHRMTVVWIGGHSYAKPKEGVREFNAGNDVPAANLLLSSGVPLWQIPMNVYSAMLVGIAELESKVKPCGEIGRHLFDQMTAYNRSPYAGWTCGESWSLGDSPAVGVVLHPDCGSYMERHAPLILTNTQYRFVDDTPMIRVYSSVNSRYILEDFFAKLSLLYGA